MPIRKTQFKSGNYYHIYNRGNNRQKIFFQNQNYSYFQRLIKKHLIDNQVEIIAYCLMPNHYHLLIHLNNDNLSELMQAFALSYTKAINNRFNRVGSLFQGPFQSIHVDTDEYLLHLSRYIHLNPVGANLVKKPQDWIYSSYLDYIIPKKDSFVKKDKILEYFDLEYLAPEDSYRSFVESQQEEESFKHLILE
ncbi:hypothetical protein CAL7716_025500 [Calothrix sp. PCC 7716]|nr:hypothetical protein CAL7716_025500 [Calothrix sp. PCC 7716]